MKVVVTGGAGFIGANLCRELVACPHVSKVVVLDDLSTGRRENLDGINVELVTGSLLDRELLADVLDDASSVVHLAARPSVPRSLADPISSHDVNATGTLYLLEAARAGVTHVVVASSSSVYGANPVIPKHEDLATRPMSPYAVSKLATESYALAYRSCFDMPVLAFRFFNVYGPLQSAAHSYAAVVPAFLDAALRGEPVTIYGDGLQTRDFTYVGSVARVLTNAVMRRVTCDTPVNLAFGTRTSLLELLDVLGSVLGQSVERQHRDKRRGDVRDSQASWARLAGLFPEVDPISLREGLAHTVDWFRDFTSNAPPSTLCDVAEHGATRLSQ